LWATEVAEFYPCASNPIGKRTKREACPVQAPRHLLLVTWAGGGNVGPMVALGRRLAARGADVRVLGPEPLEARIVAEGIGFRRQRSGDLRSLAEDVVTEAGAGATDALVVDYMQPEALCAAEHLGLPFAALVHTLYASQAAAPHSPMQIWVALDELNVLRAELDLAPLERITDLLDRSDLVLVTTVVEVDQPDRAAPANVRYVGPLVEEAGADAGWAPPPPPAGEPLVLASLGTTPMDEGPVVQRLLDAVAGLPVRAVVTLGDHLDPATFVTPANAVVVGYVRHAAVLPHASAFVTHAGLSGIGAALTFGVPMLCLPLGREQPDNAAHVESAGAGITLAPTASADQLRAGIEAVLADPRYRDAARGLADAIADLDGGNRAVDELLALGGGG
jgi:MGT family glycosyltransferase